MSKPLINFQIEEPRDSSQTAVGPSWLDGQMDRVCLLDATNARELLAKIDDLRDVVIRRWSWGRSEEEINLMLWGEEDPPNDRPRKITEPDLSMLHSCYDHLWAIVDGFDVMIRGGGSDKLNSAIGKARDLVEAEDPKTYELGGDNFPTARHAEG